MSRDSGHIVGLGGPRLKISVTQKDIDWGVRGDSGRCMVSRAIARELDTASRIETDTQTIRFSVPDARYAYLTPLTVQNYLAAFDAGDMIEPFSFTLRNPLRLKRQMLTAEGRAARRVRVLTDAPAKPSNLPKKQYEADGVTVGRRVFKTRRRVYGNRELRINREREA